MQHLVSIILPTFNVARFLQQCLDSIERQTYQNIEVIIVIDGATDGSFEIAKRFSETHGRFQVYWQENKGSGPARNTGLDYAHGELVLFVDPDDWCEPDYVERMVSEQSKADYDLVISADKTGYYNKNGYLTRMEIPQWSEVIINDASSAHDSYLQLLEDHRIGSPHGKIYKMSIIKENGVRFPDLRRSQDIVFNYRYFSYISNYLVSTYSGYVYRIIYRERMNRIKSDYDRTIVFLYNDIKDKHTQWGRPFNDAKASNYFFNIFCCMLEANRFGRGSIKQLLSDRTISHIVEYSVPERLDRRFERFLLKNNCCFSSAGLFSFVRAFKEVFHSFVG